MTTFLTKAKVLLTERDYKLINPIDLERSRANIVKKIRMYRDEIRQSTDLEYKKSKDRKLQTLLTINEELKALIESI